MSVCADIIALMAQPVVRAAMWEEDGRWHGHLDGSTKAVSAVSREACLGALRRKVGAGVTLTVEITPALAGVAEAAEIMRWDKRRVITYLDRGSFPKPFAALAATRVWRRGDVEAYAKRWYAARAKRKTK